MGFLDKVIMRESCRAFSDRKVSREDLVRIVEAGRLSPSACNSQPWKFIIVDEENCLEKVKDAFVTENGVSGARWINPVQAVIVLVEEHAKVVRFVETYYGDTQRFAQGDIGMAAMSMCYEALDLGLSTCVIGLCSQKKMEKALGIPEGNVVRMSIAVGYPEIEKEPRPKSRKQFEQVCSFNKY